MTDKSYRSETAGDWTPTGWTHHLTKKGKRKRPSTIICYSMVFPGGLCATVGQYRRPVERWSYASGRLTAVPLQPLKATWHYQISGYRTPDTEEFEDEKAAMAACENVLLNLCAIAANTLRKRHRPSALAATQNKPAQVVLP